MGIGLNDQMTLDWIFLTFAMIQGFILMHHLVKVSDFSIGTINSFIMTINTLLFHLFLVRKRRSMKKLIIQLINKLNEKNLMLVKLFDLFLTLLSFIPIIEKIILRYIGGYNNCHISQFTSILYSNVSSTLTEPLCIIEFINAQVLDASCSIYMIVFLMTYFTKIKLINGITKNFSTRWKEEILLVSNCVLDLYVNFEGVFSKFLFFKAVQDFLTALSYLTLFIKYYDYLVASGAAYQYYSVIRQAMYTVYLFAFISRLQEKIEDRCDALRHQILCELVERNIFHGRGIFDGLLFDVLKKKVTVWKIFDVNRSALLTLASACVAFPVLFTQIDSGDLWKSVGRNSTQ